MDPRMVLQWPDALPLWDQWRVNSQGSDQKLQCWTLRHLLERIGYCLNWGYLSRDGQLVLLKMFLLGRGVHWWGRLQALGKSLRQKPLAPQSYRIKERQGLEPRWIFEFRDFALGRQRQPLPLQKLHPLEGRHRGRMCPAVQATLQLSARSHLQRGQPNCTEPQHRAVLRRFQQPPAHPAVCSGQSVQGRSKQPLPADPLGPYTGETENNEAKKRSERAMGPFYCTKSESLSKPKHKKKSTWLITRDFGETTGNTRLSTPRNQQTKRALFHGRFEPYVIRR